MARINYRASSILEVVISMIILSIVFTTCLMIIINVSSSSTKRINLQMQQELKYGAYLLKKGYNPQKELNGHDISWSITSFQGIDGLHLIHLEAKRDSLVIESHNEIWYGEFN